MALNPIAYTERIVKSFLRYQLTAYPFADHRLHAQMRDLLSLDETRRSPLLKGPYVSLSRPFREGATVEALVAEGLLHPHLRERVPRASPRCTAIRSGPFVPSPAAGPRWFPPAPALARRSAFCIPSSASVYGCGTKARRLASAPSSSIA